MGMNIVIAGAGDMGYHLAEQLSYENKDITLIDVDKDALLIRYSTIGYTEVVKLLLEAGADVHANGDDALYWSARNGHLEVVKILLDKGAIIHSADPDDPFR